MSQNYSNTQQLITFLDEYIEMKGYKAKSHYLAIKKWVVEAVSKKTLKSAVKPKKSSNPFLERLKECENEST